MALGRGEHRRGRIARAVVTTFVVASVTIAASCHGKEPGTNAPSSVVLRVGIGRWSATNPLLGLRQLVQLLSIENLARTGEDGRMLPWLAKSWTRSNDGRTLTIKLRSDVKFHDGSPLDAAAVASVLPGQLRASGPSLDLDYVKAVGTDSVQIALRESSPFLTELLEVPIQKPGGAATGPFVAVPKSTTEMEANESYYLGPPALRGVHVESYPSVRTAWAEMLRGRIDMLWEVGSDALQSMQNSNTASVFSFTRRYQYVLVLNPETPALRSADVRRALNLGVDRAELVRSALNTYGVPSSGPIWPRYWALAPDLPKFGFDPARSAKILGRRIQFSCLVPPDSPFERIALELKRQLAAAGVEMNPQEVSQDELAQRAAKRQYEALLIEVISGPTLVRPYMIWHSNAPLNWGQFGNATVDAALDRVRHSASDDELRGAIAGLQRAFMDDPPAVFLAWSVRARAFSRRFDIPVEEGRDVLSTMRLWRPVTANRQVSRN